MNTCAKESVGLKVLLHCLNKFTDVVFREFMIVVSPA